MRMLTIDTILSPDDGGYYAEVYDGDSGKQVHETSVHDKRKAARHAAIKWAGGQSDVPSWRDGRNY